MVVAWLRELIDGGDGFDEELLSDAFWRQTE
jgi:hypothetical protein